MTTSRPFNMKVTYTTYDMLSMVAASHFIMVYHVRHCTQL